MQTGKLRLVYRDWPIEALHKNAFKAAEAARCAGDQGKYWEMHDRLFTNQNQLAEAMLPVHAEAIGLDAAAFRKCLETAVHAGQVRKDMADGQAAGVTGTPAFFIGTPSPDGTSVKVLRVLRGANPYAAFKQALDTLLLQVK